VAAADDPTTLTITGADAAFRLTGAELWKAGRKGEWRREIADEGPPVPGDSPGSFFGSATRRLGEALRRALDEGDPGALASAATFADGLAQQRVLDAARRSHAGGGRWEAVR
jgi:predicted dehydrogenase